MIRLASTTFASILLLFARAFWYSSSLRFRLLCWVLEGLSIARVALLDGSFVV